jgi:hypothetical protein
MLRPGRQLAGEGPISGEAGAMITRVVSDKAGFVVAKQDRKRDVYKPERWVNDALFREETR